MHSLVPLMIAMGRSRSRLSVELVEVSPGCVCKGGSDLTVISFPRSDLAVISFPRSELDSWTCFCFEMAFSLEYTLGNCGKFRVTLVGIGDDTSSVVKLDDSSVIDLDDSSFSSPWVET